MGLFDKFFGKKNPPPAQEGKPASDTANDPNMIRVFDQFGRELHISKLEWLKSVLLPNIEKAWKDPEQLAGYVIHGLQDGFTTELLQAAERLSVTDLNPERGAVLHAIILLKSGNVNGSERVLTAYMAKHGKSGSVLTNLAKVHAERNNDALALETLWEALTSPSSRRLPRRHRANHY